MARYAFSVHILRGENTLKTKSEVLKEIAKKKGIPVLDIPLNQKGLSNFWKHLFKEKIPRLMDKISALPDMKTQLLLLRICLQADETVREKLMSSKDEKLTDFVQMFWPYLDDESFLKVREKVARTAKWYKRTGLAEKIWREI